jgi:hypothetical protein
MSISAYIEYVNRKRDIEAREEDVVVSFFIKIETAYAQSQQNIGVLIMTSTDSRIPQSGENLGDGLWVKSRDVTGVSDRIDLYEMRCVCAYSLDKLPNVNDDNWKNNRLISIDYDIVEYQTPIIQGVFNGVHTILKTGDTLSKSDLPLFKFGQICPIQSSSGEDLDNPLVGSLNNLLIRLTQREQGRTNDDSVRRLVMHTGSINMKPLVIAGIDVPERSALLRSVKPIPKPGGKLECAYEIEVVIDKPLYREVLDQGYKRLTDSSNPRAQKPLKEKDINPENDAVDLNSPAKLNGFGKAWTITDSNVLGTYLMFWANRSFIDWNRTLDLIKRVR